MAAITSRAFALYLIEEKDKIFLSENGKNTNNSRCGLATSIAATFRPRDETILTNSLVEYSKTGKDGNLSIGVVTRLPLKDISTLKISNLMKCFKYGFYCDLLYILMNKMQFMTESIINWDSNDYPPWNMAMTIGNFRGPKQLIPIKPINIIKDSCDDNDNIDNVVTRFAACTTGNYITTVFMFMTYYDKCKLTIVSDKQYIKKPQQLKQCWLKAWQEFQIDNTN